MDQDSAEGEHLLLPPDSIPARSRARDPRKGKIAAAWSTTALRPRRERAGLADHDVLGHRQRGKDAARFRNVGDAAASSPELASWLMSIPSTTTESGRW